MTPFAILFPPCLGNLGPLLIAVCGKGVAESSSAQDKTPPNHQDLPEEHEVAPGVVEHTLFGCCVRAAEHLLAC